jgi:competence protein ComEC
MVGINPQILWTASFQMSFTAMVGLIFLVPIFQALGRKAVNATMGKDRPAVSTANFFIDSFSVSLGAIIGVWPLVAYYFGIISFVGPPATFLSLPALPGIIISGALTGVLGLIALPVAQVISWLTWLLLSYLLVVINAFAAIPSSYLDISSFNPNIVWGYYLALGLALWLYSRRQRLNAINIQYSTLIKVGDE